VVPPRYLTVESGSSIPADATLTVFKGLGGISLDAEAELHRVRG